MRNKELLDRLIDKLETALSLHYLSSHTVRELQRDVEELQGTVDALFDHLGLEPVTHTHRVAVQKKEAAND